MPQPEPRNIRVEVKPGWSKVVLSRPDVRNAFDDRTIAELTAALRERASDRSLRALVVEGEGPVFCAGADINWMRRLGTATPAENEADARRLSELFATLASFPCPTICVAHGAALGGGAGLVAAADVSVAEEGCKFGFTEVRLGIVPAVISQFALPAIGVRNARRYFATGEIFDAARAQAIGLVSEVAPAGQAGSRALAIVTQLLSVGPEAVRESRRIVDYLTDRRDPAIASHLAQTIARVRATDEAREGLSAFLEKRPARWVTPVDGGQT